MNDMLVHEDFATRCQKVLQVAKELYHGNPDWVTFFREVLGVGGAARNVFPTQADYLSFEKCEAYAEIQQMVATLRNRKISGNGQNEATRVITVRLPESLHEALKAEANDHHTSMNKLCISKLLQVLLEGSKSPMPQPAPARGSFSPTPSSSSSPRPTPMTSSPTRPGMPPAQTPTSPYRSSF